jgi:hypothetical protein
VNAPKTFAARQLIKRIETLIGELDVELRLNTQRRHLDVRLELLGIKFGQLMALHGNAHTHETQALEREIETITRRCEARPTLRVAAP